MLPLRRLLTWRFSLPMLFRGSKFCAEYVDLRAAAQEVLISTNEPAWRQGIE